LSKNSAGVCCRDATKRLFPPDGRRRTSAAGRKQEELRAKVAPLFNANAREIALTQNATMGTNFIANGLDLHPGDEVLLADQEHVGNKVKG
jgi:selenocysteine lyase/cysteine desulfurase